MLLPHERRRKWRLLADAWLAALSRPQGHVITLDTEQQARQLRHELYQAVRRARSRRTPDPILLDAAERCSINITGPVITIYQRVLPPRLSKLEEVTTNAGADASLDSLQQLLDEAELLLGGSQAASPPEPQATPSPPSPLSPKATPPLITNPYFIRED